MTWFMIGFGLLRLLGFIFTILLIVKVVTIAGKKMHSKRDEFHKKFRTTEAVRLAAQRFADGAITADQYKEIKAVLEAE